MVAKVSSDLMPHTSPKSSRSAPSPPRVRSTSPTAEVTTILQMFERRDELRREDQRREDQRREDNQRRIDEERRKDQRREERCEDRREAAEREARLDPRAPSRTTPPCTVTSDPEFKSNKAFDVVPLFSGADSQPLSPWTDEFLAQAEVVGDAHDNLREVRLTMRDPARAYFNPRYPASRRPTRGRRRSCRPWPAFAASSDPNMRSPKFLPPTRGCYQNAESPAQPSSAR